MTKTAFFGHPTETLSCALVPPEDTSTTCMVFRADYQLTKGARFHRSQLLSTANLPVKVNPSMLRGV